MSPSPPTPSVGGPVFLITHEFYPVRGGIATFAEEIAKASAGLGYDVEVWAPSAPPQAEKKWPFRLRRLPLKGTHDLWCQLRLALQLGDDAARRVDVEQDVMRLAVLRDLVGDGAQSP